MRWAPRTPRRGCNETTRRRDDETTGRRDAEATRRRQDSPPDARRRPAGLRQRERDEGGSRCQLDVATRPRRRGGKSRPGTCDSEAPHAPQAWPKASRRVKARRSAHASTSLFQNCDVPILMEVTRCPHALSSTPTLLAVTPLPRPETTPPVTSTYFMVLQEFENQVKSPRNALGLHGPVRCTEEVSHQVQASGHEHMEPLPGAERLCPAPDPPQRLCQGR